MQPLSHATRGLLSLCLALTSATAGATALDGQVAVAAVPPAALGGQGVQGPHLHRLTIGGRTLQAAPACASPGRPAALLARHLRQYDPAGDPRLDIRDERPFTRAQIKAIKDRLVQYGLHYPDGQNSVVTWLDFDGDGICDFTASAGEGGMHATDRMFLFRGRPQGQFQLADAYYTYMEGSIIVVPYIALAVEGEALPLLLKNDDLLLWQRERKQFVSCGAITRATVTGKAQAVPPVLTALCPHVQAIYTWAAQRLPHQNALPYSGTD